MLVNYYTITLAYIHGKNFQTMPVIALIYHLISTGINQPVGWVNANPKHGAMTQPTSSMIRRAELLPIMLLVLPGRSILLSILENSPQVSFIYDRIISVGPSADIFERRPRIDE
jgi:hypothetical protein